MRYVVKLGAVLFLVVFLGVVGMETVADAQQFTGTRPGGRAGTWDLILPLVYSDAATFNGEGGSSATTDANVGAGFGFGYNFNDNFHLNGLFTWSYRYYQATVVDANGTIKKFNNNLDTNTLSVNGVYYFLDGNITPFVSAGIGITQVDTNIPSRGTGAPSTCYWDPYWGYVCNDYVPTKAEDDLSYNVGLGVRFDMSRQFGMQFSYNKLWIDISKASETPNFDIWRLDLIFRM